MQIDIALDKCRQTNAYAVNIIVVTVEFKAVFYCNGVKREKNKIVCYIHR